MMRTASQVILTNEKAADLEQEVLALVRAFPKGGGVVVSGPYWMEDSAILNLFTAGVADDAAALFEKQVIALLSGGTSLATVTSFLLEVSS